MRNLGTGDLRRGQFWILNDRRVYLKPKFQSVGENSSMAAILDIGTLYCFDVFDYNFIEFFIPKILGETSKWIF